MSGWTQVEVLYYCRLFQRAGDRQYDIPDADFVYGNNTLGYKARVQILCK